MEGPDDRGIREDRAVETAWVAEVTTEDRVVMEKEGFALANSVLQAEEVATTVGVRVRVR
jgi:hypothetical protein